ncbi:MAG: hypothetical protein U0168_26940 [Nannocystaceae bacterium]
MPVASHRNGRTWLIAAAVRAHSSGSSSTSRPGGHALAEGRLEQLQAGLPRARLLGRAQLVGRAPRHLIAQLHREEARVLDVEAQVAVEPALQSLHRRARLHHQGSDALHERAQAILLHRAQHLPLARERGIEGRQRDARAPGDGLHPRGVVARGRELGLGRLDDGRAVQVAPGLLQPGAAGRRVAGHGG